MESGIKYHNPQPPIFITAIRCFIKCVEYYFCNKKYRKLPKHLPKTTKTPTENYQNTYRKPPKHLPKTTKTLTENHQNTYRKLPKHLPKTTKTPTENHQNTYRKPPKHPPKTTKTPTENHQNIYRKQLWLFIPYSDRHMLLTFVKPIYGYMYTLLWSNLVKDIYAIPYFVLIYLMSEISINGMSASKQINFIKFLVMF